MQLGAAFTAPSAPTGSNITDIMGRNPGMCRASHELCFRLSRHMPCQNRNRAFAVPRTGTPAPRGLAPLVRWTPKDVDLHRRISDNANMARRKTAKKMRKSKPKRQSNRRKGTIPPGLAAYMAQRKAAANPPPKQARVKRGRARKTVRVAKPRRSPPTEPRNDSQTKHQNFFY
jgi:hypothetical protein